MNLTDDDILKFQKGTPIFLDDICAIYPATVGEIIDEGYSKFQQYLSIILADKPAVNKEQEQELQDLLTNLTDFQYILMTVMADMQANQTFRNAFRFFTHESKITVLLNPAQIVVGNVVDNHVIDERKFYEFRSIIKHMYFIDVDGEDIIITDEDDEVTRAIKMRMRENREKLRRAKEKKARQEKSDLKFSDLIGSMPFRECNLNMENIWNITYYSFYDQLKRSGWHEQFEINNRAALAGAKLKKSQLKHWMRSIASSDKS